MKYWFISMAGVKGMTTGVRSMPWSSTHVDGATSTTGNCKLLEVTWPLSRSIDWPLYWFCAYVVCSDQEWHGWDRYLEETEADPATDDLFTPVRVKSCVIAYWQYVRSYPMCGRMAPPACLLVIYNHKCLSSKWYVISWCSPLWRSIPTSLSQP